MEKNITFFIYHFLLLSQRSKKYFYTLIFLLCFCLLSYNAAAIFFTHVPDSFPAAVASPQRNVTAKSPNLKTHFSISRERQNLAVSEEKTQNPAFEIRVTEFFAGNLSGYPCELRFFMTWMSTQKSFGNREIFAIKSLFKFNPNSCLIIASTSLDSRIGNKILKPFLSKGLKVTAISPDFNCLFRNTPGLDWYSRLMEGNVDSGDVPLGQNLSNLMRLVMLYKFGGIYVDTDVIILRSFKGLRNVIGAQTCDLRTGNWTRLNNAVMIFDAGHPLLFKFIQEFARTFNGNKWGHNGPYLVSRVASRGEYNFTVLPPVAFYPINWSKIRSLFEGPERLRNSKWLAEKMKQIWSKSFAIHLWNKKSKEFEIEKGSIIHKMMIKFGFSYNFATHSKGGIS